MTSETTTTLPPSVETLRSLMEDQAKHIGQQRERIKALEAALNSLQAPIQRVLFDALNDAPHRDKLVGIGLLHEALSKTLRARAVLSGEAK